MKKVSLITMGKEREAALNKLKALGVMHLINKDVPPNNAIADLHGRQTKVLKVLGTLSKYPVKKGEALPEMPFEPLHMVDSALELIEEKDMLQEQLINLHMERRRVEGWGNFDPNDFAILQEHGVNLFLYVLPLAIYKKVVSSSDILVLSQGKAGIMAVAVGAEIPGMKPFVLPDHSLSAIDDLVEATSNRVGEIDAIFVNLAQHKAIIEAQNSDLLEKIEYETAKAGMETLDPASVESSIAWLGGYVPSEKIDALKKVAEENVWTLVWDDPAPTDQPPTLLKNNAVVRIIQPLFSVLGTVPGYREYDISLSYMFFMCFFFAMIFGDAGYGAFLFVVGLVIGLLMKKKNGTFPDATKLVMLFSVFAIIWGSMIGSWFGIPVQSLPLALQALILPPFNNTGVPAEFPPFLRGIFKLPETVPVNELKTQWSIQFLCFTIGMFQLVWGRLKNTFNRLPHLAAVAELGWLVVVIGMYFLVLSILLKIPLPTFPVYFIVAGLAANLIFAEQKGGNFFKNIGKSLGNFFQIFLKVVGCFADIISYIRLFAVGMAGAMIAQTFNGMAIPADGLGDFGLGFVLRLIPAVLILAVGHALNLLMNTLSLIIHGVRLNLLEYAGNHLGMDWSGYAYKPFASRQKNTMNE